MTEELLNTVLKLYKSGIEENIWFADNIVIANGYDSREASILYQNMSRDLNCVDKSRIFYTLLLSKSRQEYEANEKKLQAIENRKNETII